MPTSGLVRAAFEAVRRRLVGRASQVRSQPGGVAGCGLPAPQVRRHPCNVARQSSVPSLGLFVSLSAFAGACASPSAPAPAAGDAGSAKASVVATNEAASAASVVATSEATRAVSPESEAGDRNAPPTTGGVRATSGGARALPVETLPSAGGRGGAAALARHRPAALDEPAKRAGIKPGPYACRVDAMYKMRDCTVERDADGRTWLTVHEGNLIGMKGLLWDEGAARFRGVADRREALRLLRL